MRLTEEYYKKALKDIRDLIFSIDVTDVGRLISIKIICDIALGYNIGDPGGLSEPVS